MISVPSLEEIEKYKIKISGSEFEFYENAYKAKNGNKIIDIRNINKKCLILFRNLSVILFRNSKQLILVYAFI